MNIATLKAKIKSGQLDKFYVFVGEEIEVMRLYVNQLAKSVNKKVQVCESVEIAVKQMGKGALLNESKVYYVIDDDDFIKQSEKVINAFLSGEVQRDNILVLRYISLDKRTKFYKAITDRLIEFEQLKSDLIVSHLKKKCGLSEKNCRTLIEWCSQDYGRILLELDKILSFGGDPNEAFEILTACGVIHRDPEDAIFKLTNAIAQRNGREALRLYSDCAAIGESNIAILSVLYNTIKQVFQVQNCVSGDIQKLTGLTQWQINSAKARLHKYSNDDLKTMLYLIRDVDTQIKTGKIDEALSVPYILIQLFA